LKKKKHAKRSDDEDADNDMLSQDDGNFEYEENAQKDRVNDDSDAEQVVDDDN